jgi:integral membrane sensor domain MASE1
MRKFDSKLSWLFLWIGIAVVYAVTGRLCVALSAVVANVSWMLYIPAGLSLTSALLWGSRVWPGIFAGELAMGLVTGQPLATASIMAVGNGLDAFLAGWWFHDRLGRRVELDLLRDVVELIVAELLVLQPLCTAFGMGALIVTGRMPAHHLGETAAAWYSANLYAEFVTAPVALAWLRWPRPLAGKAQGAELAVLAVLGIAVGVASRGRWDFSPVPLEVTLILIFPLLVWGSIRFAPTVAVTMGIVLALFAFDGAMAGLGPFQGMSVQERLLSLNVSMSVSIGTGLFLAAAAANERRFEDDQAKLIVKLQAAVEQVSRLEEIVTFCAWTGRIRMGEEWVSVERFLSERYNLNISHGISDDAMKRILKDAGLELPPRLAEQADEPPAG